MGKVRLNRHARKRRHRRLMEKRRSIDYRTFDVHAAKEKCRRWAEENYRHMRPERNGGWDYWDHCYLSGPRGLAKTLTNRKLRTMFRNLSMRDEEYLEDAQSYCNGDYRRVSDYKWIIW